MIQLVASFFFGCFSVQYLDILLPEIILLIVWFWVLVFFDIHWKRIAVFLLGVIWVSCFSHTHLYNRLADDLQGKTILVTGEVLGLPNINSQRVRFNFRVIKSDVKLPKKIQLSWYYPQQTLQTGQHWRFWVKLKQPHGSLNPGGFDYERWLFTENIGAKGYIRQPKKAQLLVEQHVNSIAVLRAQLIEILSRQPINKEALAFIKALTVGDKSMISREQWQLLSKTGTNHLMAISGLHIGLVAGLAYRLVFFICLRLPVNQFLAPTQIASVASVFFALLYAALAGFSVPTQRALIMVSIFSLGIILKRKSKPFNVLALAFFVILVLDPLVILSNGLYLSFLAVAIILYSASARLGTERKLVMAVKLHLLIALGLLPLLALFFQSMSLVSPLANSIAVPLVGFIVVPITLLAVVLLLVLPDIETYLLQGVAFILQYLSVFLSFLAQLPLATIYKSPPEGWVLLIALLGVLLLFAPKGIPHRYLGGLLMMPLLLNGVEKPNKGEVWLSLLDVGQGLSVVVETAEHRLLFDTGAKFSETFNMGSAVVLPFLRSRDITVLDTMIISHADNDHIGGAESVLSNMRVGVLLSSVPEKLKAYSAQPCINGQLWHWDDVIFTVLSPPQDLFNDENNNSCVLKIEGKYGSFLLTGDIELLAEQFLVNKRAEMLKSDVLVAPHHGSKSSSSQDFLAHILPEIILIPADSPNRFNFPHKVVLERYAALPAQYYVTGKEGTLRVKSLKEGLEVESYREKYGHYWNKSSE